MPLTPQSGTMLGQRVPLDVCGPGSTTCQLPGWDYTYVVENGVCVAVWDADDAQLAANRTLYHGSRQP